MLAYLLAFLVGSGSFALYMAAFFFPEVHRKQDFVWSGLGMFYALVLFVCGERITGGLLLGQTASVALLGWFAWQTLVLRRQLTPIEEQTPAPEPEELAAAVQELTTPTGRAKLTAQLGQQLSALRQWGQAAIATTTQSQKSSEACPVPDRPYVPLTPADFEAARRDRLAAERQAAQLTVTTEAQPVPEVAEPEVTEPATTSDHPEIEPGTTEPLSLPPQTVEASAPDRDLKQTSQARSSETIAVASPKRSSESPPKPPRTMPRPAPSQSASAQMRSAPSSSSSAKTTPAPSGGGLFGLLKPKESKSVYVRKQYREETEAVPSDRPPSQVAKSPPAPAIPTGQPEVQESRPVYVRKKYREPVATPAPTAQQPPVSQSVYVRKKYREPIEAPEAPLEETPQPTVTQPPEQAAIAPTTLPVSEPMASPQAASSPSVHREPEELPPAPPPKPPLLPLDALEVTEEIVEDLLEDLAAEESATPTKDEPAVLEVEFVGEDEALWAESIAAVMESTIEPLPDADESETQNWDD